MFEWCEGCDRLQDVLEGVLQLTQGRDPLRVLVVGCGTSELSVELWRHGSRHVHSVDVDATVIEAMRHQHAGCEGLTWQRLDLIAEGRLCLANDNNGRELDQHAFDLAVDKGTLDYFLCGEVYTAVDALAAVHAALDSCGLLLVISIRPVELMRPLLTSEGLGFEELRHWSLPPEDGVNEPPTSAVVLRRLDRRWTFEARSNVVTTIVDIMDAHFGSVAPLLTEEREQQLRQAFMERAEGAGEDLEQFQIPIEQAYELMFPTTTEREEYTLELFLEDFVADAVRTRTGASAWRGAEAKLSLGDALGFLRRNQ